MTDSRNADKYQPGDKVKGQTQPTDNEIMAEVIEFEADLAALILDLRQRRNNAPPGDHKAKLRAVGSRLEDALREIRLASLVVRNLPLPHDGRGPG